MNFGLRLPGPFRVNVSSKGRVTAGVNLGPLSLSGAMSSGRPAGGGAVFMEGWTILTAVESLRSEGWKVTETARGVVYASRRFKSLQLVGAPGGVVARRTMSNASIAVIFGIVLAVGVLCAAGIVANR